MHANLADIGRTQRSGVHCVLKVILPDIPAVGYVYHLVIVSAVGWFEDGGGFY